MSDLSMAFASGLYDRMQALHSKEVKAAGIELNFVVVNHPRDLFDRQAKTTEFDSSELSASEYITGYAKGDRTWVAIPVFPSRLFRHGFIVVNTDKIKSPADLNNARIGVQLYTMTAAVYIRGLLQDEYGVDLSTIKWIEGSLNSSATYGHPTKMPSANISINKSGKSLDELLVAGEIDAVIGAEVPASLGRETHVQRLFPDFKEEEKKYYRKTGIFPIMHVVVIRRKIYEQERWVAKSLFHALEASKNIARDRMLFLSTLRYMLPWLPSELDEIEEVFGGDPWPYGIKRNRKTLETLVKHLADQGMIEEVIPLEELFVAVS
ncbi:dihydroxyphthalate decarboxylase [Halenospora varia]|nr:dihydroxyphthalate decarboxylase [Halenospora varia]